MTRVALLGIVWLCLALVPAALLVAEEPGTKVRSTSLPVPEDSGTEIRLLSDPLLPLVRINGREILFREIQEAYQREWGLLVASGVNLSPAIHALMLQNLIESAVQEHLMLRALEQHSITVPREEVLEVFNKFKQRFEEEGAYTRYLEEHQLSAADVLAKIEQRLRLQAFEDQVLYRDLTVGEQELLALFDSRTAQKPEEAGARVRQILIYFPNEATPGGRHQIRERMENVRRAVLRGEDFDAMARRISQGATADRGGEIGWVRKDSDVHPALRDALRHLMPGDLSAVLETESGVHLIQVLDVRFSADQRKDPEILQKLRDEILWEYRRHALQQFLDRSAAEAGVEILTAQ